MTERGGPPRWLVALGCALALPLVVVPLSSGAFADRAGGGPVEAVALPPATNAEPSSRPVTSGPFVVARDVAISSAPPAPPPKPGVPVRLVVPSLHVDAPVVPIGVSNGVLLPPGDPQTLGWWSDGAQPGASAGGALITGHTVHSGGGAFDDLESLRRGDVVKVRTPHGVLEYEVSAVTIYRKSTLARDAERVFSQTVPGRLVLITCEDWNGSGYDSNAVVLADPV